MDYGEARRRRSRAGLAVWASLAMLLASTGGAAQTPEALCLEGETLLAGGRPQDATEAFTEALKILPTYARAHSGLGMCYAAMAGVGGASPADPGLVERALVSLRQGLTPDGSWLQGHLNLADVLLKTDQLDASVGVLTEALELNPYFLPGIQLLGNAFYDRQDYAGAWKWYGRYMAVDSTNQTIRTRIQTLHERYVELLDGGLTRLGQGDVAGAVADFRQATLVFPEGPEAYNNLGLALSKQRQWEEALLAFERARELQPDAVDIYINLGLLHFALEQPDKARTELERALEVDPTSLRARLQLGNLYLDQEETAAALAQFNAILDRDPTFAPVYERLGYLYDLEGDLPQAITMYQRATMLEGRNPEPHYQLAMLFIEQTRYEDAWKEIRFLESIGHREAAALRQRLQGVAPEP